MERIRAGEAAKVVLAHDMQVITSAPVDERYLLLRLAADYPTCATFAVDGLVGATPEMLMRRTGVEVTSRVLAGTAWPEHSGDQVEKDLLASAKDLEEHEYAVRSVASVLAPVTSELVVPVTPHPLTLTNLTHLATDVHGRLIGDAGTAPSALDLAARLHPTAAVGGTPTAVALAMIADLEPVPRGRYAAPVGWMDAERRRRIRHRAALRRGVGPDGPDGCRLRDRGRLRSGDRSTRGADQDGADPGRPRRLSVPPRSAESGAWVPQSAGSGVGTVGNGLRRGNRGKPAPRCHGTSGSPPMRSIRG